MIREEALMKFNESFERAFMEYWMQQETITAQGHRNTELVKLNHRQQPYYDNFIVDNEHPLFTDYIINSFLGENMPFARGTLRAYRKIAENSESSISIRWSINGDDWSCAFSEDEFVARINRVHLESL